MASDTEYASSPLPSVAGGSIRQAAGSGFAAVSGLDAERSEMYSKDVAMSGPKSKPVRTPSSNESLSRVERGKLGMARFVPIVLRHGHEDEAKVGFGAFRQSWRPWPLGESASRAFEASPGQWRGYWRRGGVDVPFHSRSRECSVRPYHVRYATAY